MFARHRALVPPLAFAAGLLCAISLVACGGGGGGTPGPAPTATPAPGLASVGYLTKIGSGNYEGQVSGKDGTAILISASTDDLSLATSPPSSDTLQITLGQETPSSVLRGSVTPAAARKRARGSAMQHAIGKRRVLATPKLFALLSHARRAVHSAKRRTSNALPTGLDSTADIWTLTNGNVYIAVPSTLLYKGTHADIWVDDSLSLSPNVVHQISLDYDNTWSADTLHVGTPDYTASSPGAGETATPCNSSGQPIPSASPVPVFIPDTTQRQAVFVISSASNGNFGSYFDPINLVNQPVANCVLTNSAGSESNEAAGLYLEWPAGVGSSGTYGTAFELDEDAIVLSAYDLAELIDFVGHDINGPSPPSFVSSSGTADALFIENGIGLLAGDFALNAAFPSVPLDVDGNIGTFGDAYLQDPPAFSLTSFYGTDAGSSGQTLGCIGCFGVSYLFQRYAYDRFGGDRYLHSLVTSGETGFANLQQAFGGTSPQSVISDFAVAMQASGQNVTSDPRFNVSGFNMFAYYVDQFGNAIQLSGPSPIALQQSGTIEQHVETLGTFFYLPIGNPNGATIQEADLGGQFGLAAALEEY